MDDEGHVEERQVDLRQGEKRRLTARAKKQRDLKREGQMDGLRTREM